MEKIQAYLHKALDAEARAAKATDPDLKADWQSIARIFYGLAEVRKRAGSSSAAPEVILPLPVSGELKD